MIVKTPILSQRVRQVPKSFSWIDHRLVSDCYINKCSHAAAALYLFLVCVGDRRGLSYYSDKSIAEKLKMDAGLLEKARSELIRSDLLAWRSPIYQVLSMESATVNKRSSQGVMRLSDIFKQAREGSP